ncbi:MAG: 16S rRNA (cytidine(1402)-2'-O)-methyltransferase, partial [Eggerthellaceae bacterium]|nr:16S rRNA (cytidine(1402)-2'-O)-methyltransferase [Eggerthellaceae bacterium]
MSKSRGKITICATPIGNLMDVSERVFLALTEADIIYAEDTRVAARLLTGIEILQKPLKRLDEKKMKHGLVELMADVEKGKQVVYVSDAGTPGVSDPGLEIVRLARDEAISLVVLPGPSAAILAYVYSGFEREDFYFAGFLPRKEGQIDERIDELKDLTAALIFYESPKRIIKSLEIFSNRLPQRNICLCRELTKLHEDIIFGTAEEIKDELIKKFNSPEKVKGEICLVIDADKAVAIMEEGERFELAKQFLGNISSSALSNKDKMKLLVKYFNLNKKSAYELVHKESN